MQRCEKYAYPFYFLFFPLDVSEWNDTRGGSVCHLSFKQRHLLRYEGSVREGLATTVRASTCIVVVGIETGVLLLVSC